MVELDETLLSTVMPISDENSVPVDASESINKPSAPPLTIREKIALRIAAVAAKKPLALSQPQSADVGEELVLDEEKPIVVVDKASKWLAEKAHIAAGSISLPKSSPKTPNSARKRAPIRKADLLKNKLAEKLRIRRREEQEQRFAIYNADNEIADEEPEEEDSSSEDDEEKVIEEAPVVPKKKFTVNEDEELIEIDDDENEGSVQEDEEDEKSSDDEEVENNDDDDGDDKSDNESETEDIYAKPTRVVLSSDDEEEPNEADSTKIDMPSQNKPVRLIMSDDDISDDDEDPLPSPPPPPPQPQPKLISEPIERIYIKEAGASNEAEIHADPISFSQVFTEKNLSADLFKLPLSQLIDVPKSPSPEPERPMRILEIDESSDREDLMELCSGKFESQTTQQTYSSKMDINDYLSDSPGTFATPNPSSVFESFDKRFAPDSLDDSYNNLDTTAAIVEQAYAEFNNPDLDDDRVVPVGMELDSDSDDDIPVASTSQSRKRKIVVYSDDEDDENDTQSVKKQKKVSLFDSDDEDNDTEADVSVASMAPMKEPFLIDGMEDVFTTEDTGRIEPEERVFQTLTDDENDEPNESLLKRGLRLPSPDSDSDDDDNFDSKTMAKKTRKFLEDEASLSGDDVGDDIDEDELGDEYEREEGDEDEVDDDEVRRNLAKQFLKQQNDDEERRLLQIQQKLFADSDLHGVNGNMDRSFRFRMRKEISDEDWQALVKMNSALADFDEGSDDEEDAEARQKSLDMKKWLMKKKEPVVDKVPSLIDDDMFDSPLLALGKHAMHTASSSSTNVRPKGKGPSNDSLLRNSNSLGVLLKDISKTSSSSSTVRSKGFFSSVKQL